MSDFVEYPGGAAVQALRAVLERTRPEIVHADNYRAIVIAALASEGLDVRRSGVVRDNRFHCVRYDQSVRVASGPCGPCDFACAEEDLASDPAFQRSILDKSARFRHDALRAFDRVVVTSAYLRQSIAPIVGDDRLVTIANTPDDYQQSLDFMEGVAERPGTNILIVGMLNENKGQAPLVKRLRALVERVPDAVLHFAGRGARIEKRLRELAAEMGLGERLVFHGYIDRQRLYELYRECQIVALPTVWPEPFGRVPLEAAIARRPVVSFAVGGLRESILDGDTGLLVEPGDIHGFIEALGVLADDPQRRRAMGASAHDHVLRTYQLDVMKGKLLALWAGMTTGKEATP